MNSDGIQDRLIELMGDSSKASFSKRCGFSVGALNNYLSGSMPSADKAMRIAEVCGVRLEWLIHGEGPKHPEPPAAVSYGEVPRYDLALAAGHGSFVDRAELLDHIPFTQAFLRRKLGRGSVDGLVMLDARGDSMEPTIGDGDLVMVDTNDTQLRDGLMAYVLDDVAFIKRISPLMEGGVEIISDNRDVYKPQRLSRDRLHDIQVIGRVRWVGKVL
jgi:phage repressor protein C with HTH and peptisase S24 domain